VSLRDGGPLPVPADAMVELSKAEPGAARRGPGSLRSHRTAYQVPHPGDTHELAPRMSGRQRLN
jgi:hypothetical protein